MHVTFPKIFQEIDDSNLHFSKKRVFKKNANVLGTIVQASKLG